MLWELIWPARTVPNKNQFYRPLDNKRLEKISKNGAFLDPQVLAGVHSKHQKTILDAASFMSFDS